MPTSADVANMVAATSVKKRKRAGTHVVPQAGAAAAPAPAPEPKAKRVPRPKSQSAGNKGVNKEVRQKKTVHRGPRALPPVGDPAPASAPVPAPDVLDELPQRYVKFFPESNGSHIAVL